MGFCLINGTKLTVFEKLSWTTFADLLKVLARNLFSIFDFLLLFLLLPLLFTDELAYLGKAFLLT
jgi:hypothetical protein